VMASRRRSTSIRWTAWKTTPTASRRNRRRGGRLSWAASFVKDFVVVKDLLRHRVEDPSQQQKFT
jgi:hypothetical protein